MTDCACNMDAMWWEGAAPICTKGFEEVEPGVDACAHCTHSELCHDPSESDRQRTIQQNKAIHLYCQQLAESLNAGGLDQRKVFEAMREGVEIPWSGATVKENLWRTIQQAVLQKESTTELTTEEVSRVYVVLNRFTAERFNLSLPFPDRFGN